MAMIVRMNPKNISNDGTSEYINNPNISAARGSAPDMKMDEIPESIYFKLNVERIYGRANENVECRNRNIATKVGLMLMKLLIWLKFVNGINAMDMNMIE